MTGSLGVWLVTDASCNAEWAIVVADSEARAVELAAAGASYASSGPWYGRRIDGNYEGVKESGGR